MSETRRKRCVLVVDDEPKLLRFVAIALKLHGYEVVTTTSGLETLDLVDSAKPDIVLLDVVMPDIDGFEVLKELRTSTDLPVIVFSASHGNRENAVQLGASDFIPKPFKAAELIGIIERLVPELESRQ
jgi:two-component system KDP operon response regulator KdpE